MTNDQLEVLAKLPQNKRLQFIMEVAGIFDRRVLELLGEDKLSDRLMRENQELRKFILEEGARYGIHPKVGPFDLLTGESDMSVAAKEKR